MAGDAAVAAAGRGGARASPSSTVALPASTSSALDSMLFHAARPASATAPKLDPAGISRARFFLACASEMNEVPTRTLTAGVVGANDATACSPSLYMWSSRTTAAVPATRGWSNSRWKWCAKRAVAVFGT